ncbi:MAG: hypothetical protein HOL45_05025, partial [Chloroflexi bacterium]|nr:hypothetical protein [Chloroflexota bacterium]
MTAISTGSRALRRNTNRDSLTEGADLRTWTGHGIEVAWLIAAVVAPVVVLSETAFISKTELPKVATVRLAAGVIFLLMLLDAGMTIWQKSVTVPSSREQLKAQVARLVSSPRTRLVTSVLGLLLATALASAFALMPDLSTWGVNPGGESNS